MPNTSRVLCLRHWQVFIQKRRRTLIVLEINLQTEINCPRTVFVVVFVIINIFCFHFSFCYIYDMNICFQPHYRNWHIWNWKSFWLKSLLIYSIINTIVTKQNQSFAIIIISILINRTPSPCNTRPDRHSYDNRLHSNSIVITCERPDEDDYDSAHRYHR